MPFSRSRSIESMTRSLTSGVGAERARLPEHGVDERRLAVVDVGDDRDVAQVLAGDGHANEARRPRGNRGWRARVEEAVVGRPRAEPELVAHAKRGDLDAFEQLVREHQGIAFRTAYVIAGSAADAEEAVQDAFVKAHRALGRFREDAPFRPWLLAIVANEARNRRRSAARRARFELHLVEERPSADAAPSPEAALLAREQRARLLAAIETLGEEQRQAVACRYLLGLSERETAAALGCRPGTVKSRVSRALAQPGGGAVSELETRLAELRVEWPPEPDVAARVRARLEASRGRGGSGGPPGRSRSRSWCSGGGVAAVPSARSAVLRWLGIEGVRIERVPEAPTPAPTTSPPALDLGERDAARARHARPARLGRPDAVYAGGDHVTLLYRPRRGLPESEQSGAGALLSQFPGRTNRHFIRKFAGRARRSSACGSTASRATGSPAMPTG